MAFASDRTEEKLAGADLVVDFRFPGNTLDASGHTITARNTTDGSSGGVTGAATGAGEIVTATLSGGTAGIVYEIQLLASAGSDTLGSRMWLSVV